MQALGAALGNPERAFRSILIAGTNGKGSVAKLLSSMMPAAGLYTSPHLVRLNERISIGGREISDDDLTEVFAAVKYAASTAKDLLYTPTYFKLVTAMAFLYFRDRVKFVVLEVGLGGRLDATNIVTQDVSVITSIGLDHQQFLGTTIEAIAAEKAGIIKSTEPVIIGPSADLPVIRERAGNRLMRGADLRRYPELRPQLLGRHQLRILLWRFEPRSVWEFRKKILYSGSTPQPGRAGWSGSAAFFWTARIMWQQPVRWRHFWESFILKASGSYSARWPISSLKK